jgi:WD40 repeat protein
MVLFWGSKWYFEDLGVLPRPCPACGAHGVHLAHGQKKFRIQTIPVATRDQAFVLRCPACKQDFMIDDAAAAELRRDLGGGSPAGVGGPGAPAIDFTSKGVLSGHRKRVGAVGFSPDGRLLASGSEDGTVKVWDAAGGQLVGTLDGHAGGCASLAFSPDGARLAAGSDQGVILWDPHTGQRTGGVPGKWAAFGPDGMFLTGDAQHVHLWEPDLATLRWRIDGGAHKGAFSPDGTLLALCGGRQIGLRTLDGAPLRMLSGHKENVMSVAFSPNGRQLASAGSLEKTYKLWDVETGALLDTPEQDENSAWDVAFSPDGQLLAGAGTGATRLFDPHQGTLLRVLTGRKGLSGWSWCWSVAFSPDGTLLATGRDDKTVQVWQRSAG